jgi:hypothetical protein
MPATAAPPAPPSTGVKIIDTPPPKPPPAPTTSIQVSQMAPPSEPLPEPKKGSAMDRLRQDLSKKAKAPFGQGDPEPQPGPTTPDPSTASVSPEASSPEEGSGAPTDPSSPPSEPAVTEPGKTAAVEGDKKGKVSPWKLLDQFKARAATLEKELADAKSAIIPEQDRNTLTERATKAETRVKQLEDEIRYVDYSKSEEFQSKYQKPYEDAWKRAMNELSELTIQDGESGDARPVKPGDLAQLVQMSAPKAREIADQVFGKFADDVMGYRREIRALFDAQSVALEEARTKGRERETQRTQQIQSLTKELHTAIARTWKEVNEAAAKDEKFGKYFTPVEGDEEGNTRLEKGYRLVDEAFAINPQDPRLSPEDRTLAVKRHAALRNRAAAFGRLTYQLSQAQSKISELQSELAKFKEAVPPAGGSSPQSSSAPPASASARMFSDLRKIAKSV